MPAPFAICPLDKVTKSNLWWDFKINSQEHNLYKCDKCDLVFYDPFPDINYESHTDSIASLKDYVQLNVNIEGMINLLMDNVPEGKVGSMLEVGCGFGFTLDFAKRMLNMEVVGYEPSLYGEIGAKELGLDIRRTYLTREDVTEKKYDLVFLSEVLEHIQDPAEFIDLLTFALTDTGMLILTTPDYKKLSRDLNRPAELAALSPEAHVILYSEHSLQKLLSEAGFSHVTVTSPGSSLVAVASRTSNEARPFAAKTAMIRKYYEKLLNEVKAPSLTYVGILSRLLRNYVDHGDYKEAQTLLTDYPFPLLPSLFEVNQVQSEAALNVVGVNCASMMCYYIGIMRLNYFMDYDQAADYFLASHLLCYKRLQFVPHAAVLEYELLWLAKFHAALALMYNDKKLEALTNIKDILHYQPTEYNKFLPAPNDHIKERANELLKTVIERI